MAARASSRAGGFAGSARHDAEIAAAAVGMSVEEWLAAAARPATPPPAHGDSESVARILSSLDRLGARIRTFASDRGHDARRSVRRRRNFGKRKIAGIAPGAPQFLAQTVGGR